MRPKLFKTKIKKKKYQFANHSLSLNKKKKTFCFVLLCDWNEQCKAKTISRSYIVLLNFVRFRKVL